MVCLGNICINTPHKGDDDDDDDDDDDSCSYATAALRTTGTRSGYRHVQTAYRCTHAGIQGYEKYALNVGGGGAKRGTNLQHACKTSSELT